MFDVANGHFGTLPTDMAASSLKTEGFIKSSQYTLPFSTMLNYDFINEQIIPFRNGNWEQCLYLTVLAT